MAFTNSNTSMEIKTPTEDKKLIAIIAQALGSASDECARNFLIAYQKMKALEAGK